MNFMVLEMEKRSTFLRKTQENIKTTRIKETKKYILSAALNIYI